MENLFELETYKLKDQIDSMMRFSSEKRQSFKKYEQYLSMLETLKLVVNSVESNIKTSRDAYELRKER